MRLTLKLAAVTIAALAFTSMTAVGARADTHDSNTLHKIGKAIQYPVRKAGENASMDVHKGLNHKSVEQDRPHNARYVVKPNGEGIYKGPNGKSHRRHRHHHHHVVH